MGLWSHAACMLSDPGVVPSNAKPLSKDLEASYEPVTCGICDSYKPPGCHHDRVSGRCISRMDHFCPWTNNAIGAKNQKNFILFLAYTSLASFYMYIVLGLNLHECGSITCNKTDPEKISYPALKIECVILLFACIFTTAMLVTQVCGLSSGLGTIDRMQLRRGQPNSEAPIPLRHVFGDSPIRYLLPLEPVFKDPEEVLHYRIPGYSSSSNLLKI